MSQMSILVGAIVIITGIVLSQSTIPTNDSTPATTPTPSGEATETPTITPSPTHSPTQIATPKPQTPTSIPTIVVTNDTKPSTSISLDSLRYPGSSVSQQSAGSLAMTSNDDPDQITGWYKEKINGMGFQAKSFVTTKSNDNVVNKLVAANGSTTITVDITREPGSSSTTIKVSLQ